MKKNKAGHGKKEASVGISYGVFSKGFSREVTPRDLKEMRKRLCDTRQESAFLHAE